MSNKAIPLVFVDESDGVTLRVSELASKLFSRRSSAKIAVVSIFGDVNSGKSYLLNRLIKESNAFDVNRPTSLKRLISAPIKRQESAMPHTKGLWVYAEPITIEKDGEVFEIFFVDSEGLLYTHGKLH